LLKQEYPPFFPSLVPTRIPFCPPLTRTVASQHLFIISLHSCSYSFPTVTPTSRSLHFSFLLALFGLKHTRLRLKQLNKPRWGPPAFGGRARRLACSLLWAEGAPLLCLPTGLPWFRSDSDKRSYAYNYSPFPIYN
jgi:hypothetical protein